MGRFALVCCFSALFTLSAGCESGRIFFGSVNETYPEHVDKNGIYIRQLESINNAPVYKHETQDYYLYFVSGTLLAPFWVVGPAPGSIDAYISIMSEAGSPDTTTGHWQIWDTKTELWITVQHLHVKCIDTSFMTCTTGKLRIGGLSPWNVHQENRTGLYILMNETHEMRPVYQHTDGRVDYLYYVNGVWMVGPDVGRVSAALFVLDYAWRPEYIVENWIVFNGVQFLKDTKFTVRCAGESINPLITDTANADSDIDISSVVSIAEGVLAESDMPLPVCDSTWCLNGGTCITNEVDDFLCACSEGYFGPTCENTVTCGDPPELVNGYIVKQTGSTYHSLVFYACEENYHLIGQAAVVCQTDGHWNVPPQCVDWLDYINPGREPTRSTRRHYRRHRSRRDAPAISLQKMKAMF